MISDNFVSLIILKSDRSLENKIDFISLLSLSIDNISIVKVNRSEMREYIHNTINWLEYKQVESTNHFVMDLYHQLCFQGVG